MGEQSVGFVGRLLRRAGYVPAARAQELSEALTRTRQEMADLKRQLEAARKDTHDLKDKSRERAEIAQRERSESEARYQARIAKVEQKTADEVERLRQRETERTGKLRDIRDKLDEAFQKVAWVDKSTQLGREHLMAIEVKLDIVEGAIKVLDQRTRAALAAPARLP